MNFNVAFYSKVRTAGRERENTEKTPKIPGICPKYINMRPRVIYKSEETGTYAPRPAYIR